MLVASNITFATLFVQAASQTAERPNEQRKFDNEIMKKMLFKLNAKSIKEKKMNDFIMKNE